MRYTYLKGKSMARSMAVFGGRAFLSFLRDSGLHGPGVRDRACAGTEVDLDQRHRWVWSGSRMWSEEWANGTESAVVHDG